MLKECVDVDGWPALGFRIEKLKMLKRMRISRSEMQAKNGGALSAWHLD